MPKLLIVDDDIHLRKLVLTYAELDGYQCEEAENGQKALEKVNSKQFDIVVLDVMMPELDGFETLGEIRKRSQVPVIMLTSRGEEYDKLLGFNLGTDDYVEKPFSPKELMARIGAVLRRGGKKSCDNLTFGEFCVSPGSRTVTVGGKVINLPPKEFDLLLYLVQNERLVLSREQLLNKVWGYDYYGDARTVDTHIKSLREHLGDNRRVIQTAWGVGYKFEYE
ncbi:MAG: response regulator transcription factor [Clostridiales bacterium]|nr:response regulator transcription factor [Clostridiales bacterium]